MRKKPLEAELALPDCPVCKGTGFIINKREDLPLTPHTQTICGCRWRVIEDRFYPEKMRRPYIPLNEKPVKKKE